MKNKPNPFSVLSHYVEEQVKNIKFQINKLDKVAEEDVLDVYNQIKYATRAIDKQHTKTMSVVLSALAEYEPSVVHAFADHQFAPRIMGQAMLEKAEALFIYNSTSEKATSIAALIHHFNKYSDILQEDTNREEVTLLPLLQRYYNKEEIMLMEMQVEQALVAKSLLTLASVPCF